MEIKYIRVVNVNENERNAISIMCDLASELASCCNGDCENCLVKPFCYDPTVTVKENVVDGVITNLSSVLNN